MERDLFDINRSQRNVSHAIKEDDTMRMKFVFGMLLIGFSIASTQTSPHGIIQIECEKCHATDSWKMLKDEKFKHASTGFDLTGAHKTLECKNCHEGLHFAKTKRTCYSCHTIYIKESWVLIVSDATRQKLGGLPIWYSVINKRDFHYLVHML
jgi:hypothetical protein